MNYCIRLAGMESTPFMRMKRLVSKIERFRHEAFLDDSISVRVSNAIMDFTNESAMIRPRTCDVSSGIVRTYFDFKDELLSNGTSIYDLESSVACLRMLKWLFEVETGLECGIIQGKEKGEKT